MPSQSPKKAIAHDMDEIGDLIGKRVLVPHRIFPNEPVPRGKAGWEAAVKGANKSNKNHLDIVFTGHWEEYFFPASEVRTWKMLGEVKKKAASPKKKGKLRIESDSDSEDEEEDEEPSSDDNGNDDDFEVDADAISGGKGRRGSDDEATETEDQLPARTPAAKVVEEKDDAVVSPISAGKKRVVSAKAPRMTVAAAAAAKRKAPEPAAAAAAAKLSKESDGHDDSDDEEEEIEIEIVAAPSSIPAAAAAEKAEGAKSGRQAVKRGREPEAEEQIEEEEERPARRARTDDDAPWYVTAARELGMAVVGVFGAYFVMWKMRFEL